ncbi:hypothetical protein KIN20_035484 [Parelaphostrongylus tenuis]|uniref:Uncharacterized protein n=1 Tax=Parelaphostrongylus tenuis TaxID=148309 RepID=A0AAD5WKJ8_PARTN|nr:hypothetical protein KIN20_035484 [Parelaphostrongylus tenuis]
MYSTNLTMRDEVQCIPQDWETETNRFSIAYFQINRPTTVSLRDFWSQQSKQQIKVPLRKWLIEIDFESIRLS